MTISRFLSKREFAFLASFETVWASASRCYFWTFTAARLGDHAFIETWNRFNRRWGEQRSADFKGLRVFEPHKSGHLHCHAIINQWWPVEQIRALTTHAGFGRIHVETAWPESGDYLAKYLRKNLRGLPTGVRVWAKLGDWKHTKICNVEIDSSESRLFRYAYRVACAHIANPRERYFHARAWAVQQVAKEIASGRENEFVRISKANSRARESSNYDVVTLWNDELDGAQPDAAGRRLTKGVS